ncbi:MAG: DUF4395 domain-containing protein [Lysinibacillus sp.]
MTSATKPLSIPRPLVRLNQWTILLSVILTWFTGIYWILLLPLLANLSGVILKVNPIIKIGRNFLKKDPQSYIPEDVDQQRFNSTIATACLTLAFTGFAAELSWLAYTFSIMVAIASFVAILGFCVGCFIHFQINQFNYRRRQRRLAK